jgi:hypothetical protein
LAINKASKEKHQRMFFFVNNVFPFFSFSFWLEKLIEFATTKNSKKFK